MIPWLLISLYHGVTTCSSEKSKGPNIWGPPEAAPNFVDAPISGCLRESPGTFVFFPEGSLWQKDPFSSDCLGRQARISKLFGYKHVPRGHRTSISRSRDPMWTDHKSGDCSCFQLFVFIMVHVSRNHHLFMVMAGMNISMEKYKQYFDYDCCYYSDSYSSIRSTFTAWEVLA